MTVADEARDLLRRQRAAEDELMAVRREIDETVADRGGHVDKATAEALALRLKAANEKVHAIKVALRDVGA